jgi:hypothetical protein
MAEYLILIYGDEQVWNQATEAEMEQLMKEHMAFGEKHNGVLRGGNALQSTQTATSIRKDGSGTAAVTDGAFAETKEALGGYYVVEAANLDEALAIAKDVPADHGGVEVRPIQVFD